METNWSGKFYLEDIMEAHKISVDKLVELSGLEKEWILDYLSGSQLTIDKARDAILCEAINQPVGYFYDLDQAQLKNKN